MVSALHVGKLPPAIPVLSDSLGLGLVQGGFLLSIIQLAGMTLGAVAGTVADRMGPRRIMLIGLLLLATGSLMGAMASTPAFLLMTRAIEGMGFLMAVLPAPVLLRRLIHQSGALQKGL
ncbi:MFS transporter, partial [Arthrospira platensis SPKY1]|nr:MFS transporter [Arthrospira platensis SPKY1]